MITLEDIAAKIDALVDRKVSPALLSKRAAAKLLGVDRGTTLESMIADGQIATVKIGSRQKIPLVEVENFISRHTERTEPPKARAQSRQKTTEAQVLEELRSLGWGAKRA